MKLLNRLVTSYASAFLAAVVAFGVGALLIVLMGGDPGSAYRGLWDGAFGSVHSFSETLLRASPLLLTGLSMTVAYRCGFWNIGGEGQLQMAALAAAIFGASVGGLPSSLGIPSMIVIGLVAGAAWAGLAAFLKVRFRVNEVISTLLMNYIALLFVEYMAKHVVGDPSAFGWGVTEPISPTTEFPIFVEGTRLHIGLILAIVSSGLVYVILWRTTFGYKIRAVGLNPSAAMVGGISVRRYILLAALLSGALSGLAGVGEIAGIHHRIIQGFSPGYGYSGIIIALLARLEPVAVIVMSVLYGGLSVGADTMSRTAGIDIALVEVITGLIVLFVIAGQRLRGWKKSWILSPR
jgi:ABC-type uncharacterized transport system permease subunit